MKKTKKIIQNIVQIFVKTYNGCIIILGYEQPQKREQSHK